MTEVLLNMVSETVAKVLDAENNNRTALAEARRAGEELIEQAHEYARQKRAEAIEKAKSECAEAERANSEKADAYAEERAKECDEQTARIKELAAQRNSQAAQAVIERFFG